ncbi:MAG: SET domain-containing histone-lysine N-methyltransferase [Pseudomonadota bacterium]
MTENIQVPADSFPYDGALASIDSEKIKMRNLIAWLEEQGATFPSAKIETGPGWREARASAPIKAGSLIMHIPKHLFITTEDAKESEIGRLIAASNCDISDAGYMAAHLAGMKRQSSFWDPYLNVLPNSFPDHPDFLTEPDLEYLKGSYVLRIIRRRRNRLAYEYEQLRSCLPKEKIFMREEYAWGKCIYFTRTFTVKISGVKTNALIPLADMLDHSASPNALWGSESSRGFFFSAVKNIEINEALTISYWRKCSGYTLAYFGFCLEGCPDNVAEIALPPMGSDHPCFEDAKNLGVERNGMRVFRVPRDFDAIDSRALFSYLRLSAITHLSDIGAGNAWSDIGQVGVINDTNELSAMTALGVACRSALKEFDTSEAEDDILLRDDTLPQKLRNLVQVRRGEKVILNDFLNLAETTISALVADVKR